MSAAEALAPEQSVDEVRESLSVTEKGQPANTIGNCRTVFCHDPLLRGAIRLNLLTDRVDIVQDLGWRRNTSALTDTDVKYLLLYFEKNYELTSEKKITAALSIVANENCYHPIQDVLNSLVWDGTPRIRSCLHHFLGARCQRALAIEHAPEPPADVDDPKTIDVTDGHRPQLDFVQVEDRLFRHFARRPCDARLLLRPQTGHLLFVCLVLAGKSFCHDNPSLG